ncbi:MAG: hypothetical protein PF637_05720 [Spirochaetes bacterium]|nr:hypothetical protein [Spirochaetota bacterium]
MVKWKKKILLVEDDSNFPVYMKAVPTDDNDFRISHVNIIEIGVNQQVINQKVD